MSGGALLASVAMETGALPPADSGNPTEDPLFRSPQVVLFSTDVERAAAFYRQVGFVEVFRTPAKGTPIHVDLQLDGYRLGLASEESTREDHGMEPVVRGQRAAVILWTDDTARAFERLQELGAMPVKEPSSWLGRLEIAWVEDLDGHLVQVVQDKPFQE